ncbi:16S rRNA (guanine1207-N2)-methyltransferase [Halopseudomonas litoralis]|uniref:16S rRNA (Guanine1207-N2)-methyltransferase n=1 Tax=Halopseudomonas litoralis TaxID=797277 RepID=A0A1H1U5W5_9GAMM|nr:methyltransferase [Halopseudomonas litoralis]SDS67882.1 16S rRNA (guanine1207-N2)-methyltransferase [Halopseudomonas litoralis]
MHVCDTPFGTLQLDRYPPTRNPTLQPFDAADMYLLQTHADMTPAAGPVLVVNDNFGTLACALALAGTRVLSWGDSHLAERALQLNAGHNQLPDNAVAFVDSQELPTGTFARVLLRIPKSLALLEDQLNCLRPLLAGDSLLIAGAMLKHLPPRAGDLLALYVGSYQASLAWKKARLLTARFDSTLAPATPQLTTHYTLPDSNCQLANLPGVFSRERLDIGTRVMLPCIPQADGVVRIVDLGCGNGALGIQAARLNTEAQLTFVDESFAAIASARKNFRLACPGRDAVFAVSDGLMEANPASADLVLCNPPFHQQQVIGDEIAMRLFQQSRDALVPGGTLLVVGNRHLGYHVKLRRFFDVVEQIGGNSKFVVLRCLRG